uniref:HTH_48 domain-containing protein n=1 Tax=Panagrellus redivivus TaxID=6233 RepID=A0A7E4ZYN7_PANRE
MDTISAVKSITVLLVLCYFVLTGAINPTPQTIVLRNALERANLKCTVKQFNRQLVDITCRVGFRDLTRLFHRFQGNKIRRLTVEGSPRTYRAINRPLKSATKGHPKRNELFIGQIWLETDLQRGQLGPTIRWICS